jgi:hypothetical protein
MKPPPLAAQLEDGHLREPHERLCDIDRPFFHVTDHAAFRCGSGERPRWASRMLASSRASLSPCPPGTRARCAAASRSPASLLRYCGPFGLAQQGEHALLLGHSLRRWFVTFRRHLGGGLGGRDLAPSCRTRCNAPLLGCGGLILRFRDFAMERDDMGLGSVGSRRRN